MDFQTAMRAAAVQLLKDYAADADIRLQVYPGRPLSVNPPTAFVEGIRESVEYTGPTLRQRSPVAEVIVIHRVFDSKEAVDQKDPFVNGFLDWVTDRYHAAGTNTLIWVRDTEDLPTYVTDWLPPDNRLVYYATRITLEGLALE